MTDYQILNYIRGELSAEQARAVLDWIAADPRNQAYYGLMRKAWDLVVLAADTEALPDEDAYQLVRQRLTELQPADTEDEESKHRRYMPEILRAAAAVAVAVLVSWYFFSYRHTGKPTVYHQVEVATGQRVKLVLGDSTTVWLSAGTRFSYPEKFSEAHRHVILDGEAQFQVKHRKQAPFEVETNTYNVEVRGTTFNVYAYDESSRFETTLYEGAVLLRQGDGQQDDILLKPGQQAVYDKTSNRLSLYHEIDTAEMETWIAGYIIFNKTPFKDMAERLSRYYQKPIIIKNPAIAAYECTGKFHYQEKLEKILDVVSTSKPFEYRVNPDEVIIY